MDNPLHIRVFCAPEQAEEHLSILGSLPATFRVIAEGQPHIALVGPDSASIAAGLASSPRALAVIDPWDIDDIDSLAASPVTIVPVGKLAPLMAELDAGSVEQIALVRCAFAGRGTLAANIYEQLSALQVLLGPLAGIATLSRQGAAYAGTARIPSGAELLWSGQSEAPQNRFELDVLGIAQRLEVIARPDGTARPAEIQLGDAGGLEQSRGVYESGLRLFWRRLAADLAGGPKTTRLADFADLLTQIRHLITPGPRRWTNMGP